MSGPKRYRPATRLTDSNQDPALGIACPQCEVPAGTPCIDSHGRPVHQARREASYRARYPSDLAGQAQVSTE